MRVNLELLHASPFYELAALLALTATLGLIGFFLRQPMIVSYIAAGVLAGPSALGIMTTHENINQMAELSITVLLFLVGMKLDLNKMKTLGSVSITTGFGQIIFTSFFGFILLVLMGFDLISSLYISVALTFSSTIIIVKLLSDKQEVDALHGRIAIGFLIIQDLVVVVFLMILSVGGEAQLEMWGESAITKMLFTICLILSLATALVLFVRYLATPLLNRISSSQEFLITFSISWAAFLAVLFSFFGLGKELGGLLAGISLASTPFRESIISRLSSLRDFLLLFFFVSLGNQMEITAIGTQIFPGIVLSLFVLVGNPLIVMAIMGCMGYRKRTGLFAGLTVAQISEFSLIFIAAGISKGHIKNDVLGLVTLIGLITISISIYMIIYSQVIYRWLEPFLGVFELKTPYREALPQENQAMSETSYDVLLFGLGRYGQALGSYLKKKNYSVLGVDYDPVAVKNWRKRGSEAVYGDIWDEELFTESFIKHVQWVISAIPHHEFAILQEDPRQSMIDNLKKNHYRGRIAVSSHHPSEAEQLISKGADLIFLPFYDAAERAVEKIEEFKIARQTRGSP